MRNAIRVAMMGLLGFGMLGFSSTSWAQARPPIVEQMAKAYGIDSWGQIDGDPLYLEHRFARVQPEAGSYVGMGAEDRKGDL